jgi:two-component system nitrogen regulation response regulator GlnG
MDGLTALPRLREQSGGSPIVVMTAFGDLKTAVKAVEAGAFDYLVKPFDLDQAGLLIRRALIAGKRPSNPTSTAVPMELEDELIGSSPPMQALFQRIALVAAADVPVLITGESGTGKERVARAIHRYGARREGPFVPVCLPALSPSLVEAELFGHAKGAFTGASHDRKGIFELAKGGSVLLDEIGDAPLSLQVKLLRAIENREIAPVGDPRSRPVDMRIIASTNCLLSELVEAGTFRQDLYFRLAAFPIEVPPLREHPDDIPTLARHFLALCRGRIDESTELTADVLESLRERPWPGNVRELRNMIERASILARGGLIRLEHLPPITTTIANVPRQDLAKAVNTWARDQASKLDSSAIEGDLYSRFLRETEPALLQAALDRCGGNRASAAQLLGIDRATLRQKLKRHEIT